MTIKPEEQGKTPEEIALGRIYEASKLHAKYLDLRVLNLNHLPPDLFNLVDLLELDISYNQLDYLPTEIILLQNLQILDIVVNKITSIPPEIGRLINLRELHISNNRLIDLPSEIGLLRYLEDLDVHDNEITVIPAEIENLQELRSLDLSNNKILTLPPEIGKLKKITFLDIHNNSLKALPSEFRRFKHLRNFNLRGNLLQIPPEIQQRYWDPKSTLDYYFESIKKPLREAKLLMVGQGAVGKTSLIQQLLHGIFDQNQNKTEGISISQWAIEERQQPISLSVENRVSIKLNIWDFGGQEIMHATHQFFLTKRSLYLLVLDSRLTQEENRVEYWLKIIHSFSDESPVLIVGNKIDQHPLDIDRTGLQKKYPNIVGILETSAATGAGIEELKQAITGQVNNLPHVRDLLPETWFTVKTKLEELGKQSNFITHDKYLELCAENEVSDETSQRTLIGFLHDLGVVLHFQDDPRLEALGILNPQWVTNGVYKILNSHALFQNKGVLTISMLDDILNLPEYPRGKRLFIVDMMKKFELCYDIEADKTFLVPDLLPKDEPADLKFIGIPAFEYAYPVLPSSVITRFIVRMNQKIENHFVWRTGVVLKIGENKALVKADIEDRKITIAIDGIEYTRRDALSAIRYQLDEIHGSIKGLEPQKRVPISEAPNADPLDYDYLLQLERDGFNEHPVKDGNRLVKVDVRKLLSGVVSETERKQSVGNITNIYVGGDITGGNIVAGDGNQATVESDAKKKSARKKS